MTTFIILTHLSLSVALIGIHTHTPYPYHIHSISLLSGRVITRRTRIPNQNNHPQKLYAQSITQTSSSLSHFKILYRFERQSEVLSF